MDMYIYDTITDTFVEFYDIDLNSRTGSVQISGASKHVYKVKARKGFRKVFTRYLHSLYTVVCISKFQRPNRGHQRSRTSITISIMDNTFTGQFLIRS